MRVLRPQVEEINAKYPGQDKAMERQKATMELYSRAGGEPNEWLLADVVADADLNRFIHVLPVGDRVTSPEFPLGARLVYLRRYL